MQKTKVVGLLKNTALTKIIDVQGNYQIGSKVARPTLKIQSCDGWHRRILENLNT